MIRHQNYINWTFFEKYMSSWHWGAAGFKPPIGKVVQIWYQNPMIFELFLSPTFKSANGTYFIQCALKF